MITAFTLSRMLVIASSVLAEIRLSLRSAALRVIRSCVAEAARSKFSNIWRLVLSSTETIGGGETFVLAGGLLEQEFPISRERVNSMVMRKEANMT